MQAVVYGKVMEHGVDRRNALTRVAAGAAALALPSFASSGRAFAQPYTIPEQQRRILDVARREVERAGSALWRRDMAGIADFGLPSSLPRLHFANLEAGTVRSHLVAHGKGSDPEHDGFLHTFSNEPGSLATSRGAYISYEWYVGKYGVSIRMGGLDRDNSNALPRAIVMHQAWYAAPDMLTKWGKLGRSDGCLAMAPDDFNFALTQLSGGRVVFADKLGIY